MAEIPEKQIKRLKALITEAETSLAACKELLLSIVGDEVSTTQVNKDETLGKIVEGVFDGQNMLGSDGKNYPVPANYASKSKLVQGDILKLTITEDGSFMYKQIGPIPRRNLLVRLDLKAVIILLILKRNLIEYYLQALLISRQNPVIKSALMYQKTNRLL